MLRFLDALSKLPPSTTPSEAQLQILAQVCAERLLQNAQGPLN